MSIANVASREMDSLTKEVVFISISDEPIARGTVSTRDTGEDPSIASAATRDDGTDLRKRRGEVLGATSLLHGVSV